MTSKGWAKGVTEQKPWRGQRRSAASEMFLMFGAACRSQQCSLSTDPGVGVRGPGLRGWCGTGLGEQEQMDSDSPCTEPGWMLQLTSLCIYMSGDKTNTGGAKKMCTFQEMLSMY